MRFWTFMEKALLNDLLSIRATEQKFHVILYTQLFKVVLTFKSLDKIPKHVIIIEMKATKHYFPLVPFLLLYKF